MLTETGLVDNLRVEEVLHLSPAQLRADTQQVLDALLDIGHPVQPGHRPVHTGITHPLGAVAPLLPLPYPLADIPGHCSPEAFPFLLAPPGIHHLLAGMHLGPFAPVPVVRPLHE